MTNSILIDQMQCHVSIGEEVVVRKKLVKQPVEEVPLPMQELQNLKLNFKSAWQIKILCNLD
jgi:hypothetical protein